MGLKGIHFQHLNEIENKEMGLSWTLRDCELRKGLSQSDWVPELYFDSPLYPLFFIISEKWHAHGEFHAIIEGFFTQLEPGGIAIFYLKGATLSQNKHLAVA